MKAHIETDKQYAKRVSKLKFTNDCDPDMTICELQHENEKLLKRISRLEFAIKQQQEAERILFSIEDDSNPVYLRKLSDRYFTEKDFKFKKEHTDEI